VDAGEVAVVWLEFGLGDIVVARDEGSIVDRCSASADWDVPDSTTSPWISIPTLDMVFGSLLIPAQSRVEESCNSSGHVENEWACGEGGSGGWLDDGVGILPSWGPQDEERVRGRSVRSKSTTGGFRNRLFSQKPSRTLFTMSIVWEDEASQPKIPGPEEHRAILCSK
jgi:hypothetical protein